MKYPLIAAAIAVSAIATSLPAVAVQAQQLETANAPVTDALIENFLERKPELVMIALQRAQDKQQQQRTVQMNGQVQPVASAIISGDPKVPVLGNPKGSKVVVEFFDYNCGYCKAFSSNTMSPLLTKDKNVRFHMVLTPILGPGSQRMAEMAAAAQIQGKFAAAHAFLIQQRATSVEEANGLTAGLIQAAGLNAAAFNKALADGSAKALVTHNAELARKAGIGGTPTLWFKGRTVPGAMPLEDLESGLSS